MPENRHFIVTQTREIKVAANTLPDAAQVADAYFGDKPKPEVYGYVAGQIRETDLVVREDR